MHCYSLLGILALIVAAEDPAVRKEAFVEAVTNGAGLMPWQDVGISEDEVTFRRQIEARKDRMLAHARSVEHPALLSDDLPSDPKTTPEVRAAQ